MGIIMFCGCHEAGVKHRWGIVTSAQTALQMCLHLLVYLDAMQYLWSATDAFQTGVEPVEEMSACAYYACMFEVPDVTTV